MFQNWKWLRVGLMTLAVVGAASALFLSVADAAKPGPTPPVTYTMQVLQDPAPDDPNWPYPALPADCRVLGMNNHGDLLTVFYGAEVSFVLVWHTASTTQPSLYNLGEAILDGPSLDMIASSELVWTLDAAVAEADDDEPDNAPHTWSDVWSSVVNHYFASDFSPHAINDSGWVAGSFYFLFPDGSGCPWHACRFKPARNGSPAQFIDLGFPVEYGTSYGCAINNSGDVAGKVTGLPGELPCLWWRIDSSLAPAAHHRGNQDAVPGEWELGWTGVANPLPCGSGQPRTTAAACDVNDFGQATGSQNGPWRAFRYTPSSDPYEELGVLRAGGSSYGLAINNKGHVTGWSGATSTGACHAFRCTTGTTLIDLGTLGSSSLESFGWDINDNGQVVGYADVSLKARSIFLHTDKTGMLDLWKLISNPPSGTTGGNVSGQLYINDYSLFHSNYIYGQICGVISVGGVNRPFILTPNK
jgi:probable HAF family extracellular repeat protein